MNSASNQCFLSKESLQFGHNFYTIYKTHWNFYLDERGMTTVTTLRVLLVINIIAMAGLAFAYLRQRRLSWPQFCGWGLLALAVPLLGPFLVILSRPGAWINPNAPAGFPVRVPDRLQARVFAVLGPRRRSRLVRRP
jgi:hypothetical protein